MEFQTSIANTDIYKGSFFPQTIRDWNALPDSLISFIWTVFKKDEILYLAMAETFDIATQVHPWVDYLYTILIRHFCMFNMADIIPNLLMCGNEFISICFDRFSCQIPGKPVTCRFRHCWFYTYIKIASAGNPLQFILQC